MSDSINYACALNAVILQSEELKYHFAAGVKDARISIHNYPSWYSDPDAGEENILQEAYAEGFASVVRGDN